ncbi:iron-sulfur cluster assembly accessory protein [Wenzhouxiangella sp. XN79A]|uniref:HesB/IscA family protein n=1 Tax=Wenzhouxiangella sp. XN79A TaxID=2724193 RepID=UPI00144A50FB|nr:iron-sulfur cluster assembly accessory protein [Wenzhouxiangella sp. XN79A]NKI34836.1 iron-sulfur cluster assembly accessory protein [Wenzhouxiangella sp. XN79A]
MNSTSITLTQAAAERVAHFLTDQGGVGLRLGVRRTGCSGWAYEVGLAEAVEDGDTVFEDRGIRIVVDADALPLVAGTRIDFARQGLNRQFEFENPNVTDECGCGESFTVTAG